MDELQNWLTNILNTLITMRIDHSNTAGKDIIGGVKQYLQLHFSENINLNTIAEHFYINPFYLSQLFKKKTGDTYVNFITNIRIEKAKELLTNTELKVYEISQKVGYADAKYFSKVFEKLVGVKPSEYKGTKENSSSNE